VYETYTVVTLAPTYAAPKVLAKSGIWISRPPSILVRTKWCCLDQVRRAQVQDVGGDCRLERLKITYMDPPPQLYGLLVVHLRFVVTAADSGLLQPYVQEASGEHLRTALDKLP
jgi:hypothetical protein